MPVKNDEEELKLNDASMLQLTAKELSSKIASGEVDCVELMRATLDRIETIVQPRLNPFILLKDRTDLMEQAAMAANEVKQGKLRGWLHGIPTAVKDLVNVRGFATTLGGVLPPTCQQLVSDPHIQRLQDAGVIIIGKTNVPAFGLGSHTFNPVYGITRNPWGDHSRSAGGSSGGAAVALATQCLAVADGTDMGGSLRNPAGWNSIYSIRPTAGLLSSEEERQKNAATGPLPYPLSTSGPLARCIDDLGSILETMAGPAAWKYEEPIHQTSSQKILWLADWGEAIPVEDGILRLCEQSLHNFFSYDFEVEDSKGKELFPISELWDSWVVIRSWVIAKNCKELSDIKSDWSDTKAELQWEMKNGSGISNEQLEKARATVQKFMDWLDVNVWSKGYSAFALPSAQVWPFPVEQDYPTQVEGSKMELYHEWMKIMIMVSVGGLPCVTVPAGFGKDGLPIGIQLAGPRMKDGNLLHIAKLYETKFNACRRSKKTPLVLLR